MENPTLSEQAKNKIPEFVQLVKEELEKGGTKLEESVIRDALLAAQSRCGCDQCANGARW